MKKTVLLAILATIYTQAQAAAQFTPITDQADALNLLPASKQLTAATNPGTTSVEDVIQVPAHGAKEQGPVRDPIGGTSAPATATSNTPTAPAICSFVSALESAKSTLTSAAVKTASNAYLLFTNFLGEAKSYMTLLKQRNHQNKNTLS